MATSFTHPMPAARTAARTSRASLAIGGLGLVTSLFLVSRLIESWRIEPGSHRHTISFLGQQLSYPTANAGAIAVLALAAIGLAVSLTALTAAARELVRSRLLVRALRSRTVGVLPDGTSVIDDPQVDAFCAGLVRPQVFITTAALSRLDPAALAALLAHERHHIRRRDPLRLAAGRVLARSLFLVPWLRRLHEHHQFLAELGADESAASHGAPALARAMLAFDEHGVDPARVDRLLADEPPAWRFPAALALAAATPIALIAGTAVLATRFASGTATLAPPFLSRQPCILMLAAVPTLATLVWLRLARMRT